MLAVQRDFEAICDCGGRLAGTESERQAISLLAELGSKATGFSTQRISVPYTGWRPVLSELRLRDGALVPCNPLVRTASTPSPWLEAEVVDLGRGTPEEFAAHSQELAGRIALVRHELMFAAGTVHRRLKYEAAVQAGCIGFLISGPLQQQVVAGSCGTAGPRIPAAGISPETAARLWRTSHGFPKVRLTIETHEEPTRSETLIFDMPGRSDEWVVLSAHLDGHSLAESAIDNASGVAVALEVARRVAPQARDARRGLRITFFSIEEWALLGSAAYVASLSASERDAIALNVNLDSVAGARRLTALTSGFGNLEPFLMRIAERKGVDLRLFRPLQSNSDHANFAKAGIPAIRLVAGFDDPLAATCFVLTAADTRDKVSNQELLVAADLAEAVVVAAMHASGEEAEVWRLTAPRTRS